MNALLSAVVNGAVLSAILTLLVGLILWISPSSWFNAATKYVVWSILFLTVTTLLFAYLWPERPARTPSARSLVEPATTSPSFVYSIQAPARHIRVPLTRPSGKWFETILALWSITASVMLLRVGAGIFLLSRQKARAVAPPSALAARLETWLAQCGTSRRVSLACSHEVTTPLAAGPWRPTILIPMRLLDQLNQEEWDQVGLHEVAHLARRDDLVLLVQRIVEAVFFLHPLIHWISRRMNLEREIACDDFVLAATGHARAYAACLTRVLELSGGSHPSSIAPAALQNSSLLTRRVIALLDQTRNAGTRLMKGRLAGFVFAFLAMLGLGERTPLVIAFAAPPQLPRRVSPPKQSERVSGPVSLCLVLDTSGSMETKRNQRTNAALALLRSTRPDDEVCVVSFSDESFLEQTFTNDATKLEAALLGNEARGGSALRSAISMTLDYMTSKAKLSKKVLVVVTDGGDASSAETQDQLLRKVKGSGVRIYCIGLMNQDSALRDLSAASGGRDFYAGNSADAEKAAGEIVRLVRTP